MAKQIHNAGHMSTGKTLAQQLITNHDLVPDAKMKVVTRAALDFFSKHPKEFTKINREAFATQNWPQLDDIYGRLDGYHELKAAMQNAWTN